MERLNTSREAFKPNMEQDFACFSLFNFFVKMSLIFSCVYMRVSICVGMKNFMKKRNADALSFFEVA